MKYYIIAGEASGALHGANLIRAIRLQDEHAQFRFWGDDEMETVAGNPPVRHIRDLAIMGFVEVLTNLRTVVGNIHFCKKDIISFQPDVIVYIDYPGFNLRIAKFTHKKGFKNVHYISPQLWAWKKGRIKTMRKNLDKLCYILPFEKDFYGKQDFPQAVYVGHPLLDAVQPDKNSTADGKPIVALLPGSRRQEIKKMLPTMLRLADRHPEYQFIIAGMSIIGKNFYNDIIGGRNNVSITEDATYSLLNSAYAAIVCSGTATLETALFDVPQVVCYGANAISIAIARKLIGNRITYISLVNLIADEPIVTELIQNDMNDNRIEEELAHITTDAASRQKMLEGYTRMKELLGNSGASERCATEIIKTAKERKVTPTL